MFRSLIRLGGNPTVELAISGLILLLYFQISLIEISALLGLISLIVWTGSSLVTLVWQEVLTIYQKLSIGLSCGLAIYLFIDYLIGIFQFNHWYSVFLLYLIGSVLSRCAKKLPLLKQKAFSNQRLIGFLHSFALCLLAFNFRAQWAIPLSISLILFARVLDNTSQQPRRFTAKSQIYMILISLSLIFSIGLNNLKWTLSLSNDAGFFEALTWSLIRYGPNENPGFSNGFDQNFIPAYHTVAYSFGGLVSFVSNLEPYVFLNRLGPGLLALITASLFMSLCDEFKQGLKHQLMVSLVLTILIIYPGNYNSQTFAMVCLIVFVYTSIKGLNHLDDHIHKTIRYLPLVFVGLLTLLSKGTMLFAVLPVLLSTSIVQFCLSREKANKTKVLAVNSLIVTLFLFVVWWKFFRVTTTLNAGSTISPSLLGAIVDGGVGSALLASRYRIYSLLNVIIILAFSRQFNKLSRLNLSKFVFLICSFSSITLSLFFLFIPADARVDDYLVTTFLGLMTVILSFAILSDWKEFGFQNKRTQAWYFYFLIFAAVLYVIIHRVFIIPYSLEIWEYMTNLLPELKVFYFLFTEHLSLSVILFLTLLCSFWFFLLILLGKEFRISPVVFLSIPLLAASSIHFDNFLDFQINSRQDLISPSAKTADNSNVNPSLNLQQLGEFVRRNTKTDAVFASNNFCCEGKSWLTDILDNPTYTGESALGGANYLLPASLQRRFFIQGVRFQIGCCIESFPQHIQRLKLSLEFANTPSKTSAQALRQNGVDYFIINKDLSSEENWTSFASWIFENDEFLLLKL